MRPKDKLAFGEEVFDDIMGGVGAVYAKSRAHSAHSWRREGEGVRPGGCRAPQDSWGLPRARVTKTRSLHFHSPTPRAPVPTSAWTSGKGRPRVTLLPGSQTPALGCPGGSATRRKGGVGGGAP